MSGNKEAEEKGVLTAIEHNRRVSEVQNALVRVSKKLGDLGAHELATDILDVINGWVESMYQREKSKREVEDRELELAGILKETGVLSKEEWDELAAISKTLHGGGNAVETEKTPKVEGDTDKEKVQKMAEMTDQIYNTVVAIWADSFQKEDMVDSLAELKRIFNSTAGN